MAAFSNLLLILQPVLFFSRVLINPTAHIPFDIEGFHLPLISYIAQCVRRGIAPLWDPYPYCGVPIHADLQAQVFYPFTWLAVVAGNHTEGRNLFYWVQWLVPLHMIIGGLLMLLLLRRIRICWPAAVLGASVYQSGGFFASQAQHLGAISTGAWLPLAILAVWELRSSLRLRWIAILALAVALSILAGFAATTQIVSGAVFITAAALLITRRATWRIILSVAAGFIVGAAISAVELIPLWKLTHSSMAALRFGWYPGGGIPLQALVSLVRPDYYHIFEPDQYKLPYNFTYLYIYCGIAAFVLLIAAPFVQKSYARLFFALTILSMLWMLGAQTPGYAALFLHLPGPLRGSAYPEYASMAFCCFAGATAAAVLDRFGKRLPQAVLWGVAIFTSYDLIQTGRNRPMNTAAGGYKKEDSEYAPASGARLSAMLQKRASHTSPPSRIDYTDAIFAAGIRESDMLRLPTANGDNPFLLLRTLYVRRLFATGQPWDRQLSVNRIDSPLLNMLNIEWIVSATELAKDRADQAGLIYVGSADGYHAYRNPHVLPRFFLAPRVRASAGESHTFQILAQDSFDPAREAVVEGIAADMNGLAEGEVKVVEYSPNRIRLQVSTGGPAFLVTSEAMYEGWKATVNGKPQAILMTNGAFRGLTLPAGTSDIVMEYHPAYFVPASVLSMISLAGAIVAIVRGGIIASKTTRPRA